MTEKTSELDPDKVVETKLDSTEITSSSDAPDVTTEQLTVGDSKTEVEISDPSLGAPETVEPVSGDISQDAKVVEHDNAAVSNNDTIDIQEVKLGSDEASFTADAESAQPTMEDLAVAKNTTEAELPTSSGGEPEIIMTEQRTVPEDASQPIQEKNVEIDTTVIGDSPEVAPDRSSSEITTSNPIISTEINNADIIPETNPELVTDERTVETFRAEQQGNSDNHHAPEVQKGESLIQTSALQEVQIDNNQQEATSHEHGAGCACSACNPFNDAATSKAGFNPDTKIDLGFDVTSSPPDTSQQQGYHTPEVQKGESLIQTSAVTEIKGDGNKQEATSHEHGAGCQCSACSPFNKASGADQIKAEFKSDIKVDIPESTVQSSQQTETVQDNSQSEHQRAPEAQTKDSFVQTPLVTDAQVDNNQQKATSHEHGAGCACSACNPFNDAATTKAVFNPDTKIDLGFDVTSSTPDTSQQQAQPTTAKEAPTSFVSTNKDNWGLGDFINDAQQNNQNANPDDGAACPISGRKGGCGSCKICFDEVATGDASTVQDSAFDTTPFEKPKIKKGQSLDL